MEKLSIFPVLEEQYRRMPAEEFGGVIIDLVSYRNLIEVYVSGRLTLDCYADHIEEVGHPEDVGLAVRFLDIKLSSMLAFDFDSVGFPIGVTLKAA